MWFWFVIPSPKKIAKERDQQRSSINPPTAAPTQPENNISEHSQPETSSPQNSQPEISLPEDSQPEISLPQDSQQETSLTEDTQPRTSLPQDSQPETSLPQDSQSDFSLPQDFQPKKSLPQDSQSDFSLPQDSQPKKSIPQDSQPETSVPHHSQPKSKMPHRSQKQKPRTVRVLVRPIPSTEIIPVLKPELLCIGLIGLLHNGCLYAVLGYYFLYWAFALSHAIKEDSDNPTTDHYYEWGSLKVTIVQAACIMALHLIGMVLTALVLRMDYYLRFSTDPAMDCYLMANILQKYVVMNTVFMIYGLIMVFVVNSFIPPEYRYTFIGLMIGSFCLRIVCADIVERYLILIARLVGIETCRFSCFNPKRVHQVQAAPSDQV